MDSDGFEITASTPAEARPTQDEKMAMLRRLLADRFQLTSRSVSRAPFFRAASGGVDKVLIPARNATMSDFASTLLMAILDRPVVDHTGLSARYDFDLERTPDESQFGGQLPPVPPDTAKPSLFAAMQQFGLRLEATRGSIATLVIEKLEPPSAN